MPSRCSVCEALYQEPPDTESLPSVPALPSSFLRRKQAAVRGLCAQVGAAAAPPGKTVGRGTVWVLPLLGSRQTEDQKQSLFLLFNATGCSLNVLSFNFFFFFNGNSIFFFFWNQVIHVHGKKLK